MAQEQTGNVADFELIKSEKDAQYKPGRLERFLIWTTIMKPSVKHSESYNEPQGINYGFLFVIGLIVSFVIVGFIILGVIVGFFYLEMKSTNDSLRQEMKIEKNDIKEDWRGAEAWRQKQIYDDRREFQQGCQENAAKLKAFKELSKQRNETVPAELLEVKECPSRLTDTQPTTGDK